MEILIPITMTGKQVRDACIKRMQRGDRKDRILADAINIEAEELAARGAFAAGSHHALSPAPFTPEVSEDMVWFYESRLRDSKAGRSIWEEILALGGRRCPFCLIAKPKTIEHSFPKSAHPRVAVEPSNLVPACRDCNFERNVGSGGVSVSPYFDHWVMEESWLYAEIVDLRTPSDLEFTLMRPLAWNSTRWGALTQFVDDIDLLDRYVAPAIEAFSGFVSEIRLTYASPTVDDIRAALDTKCQSCEDAFGINRWQTAAFDAWRKNVMRIDWVAALA